jgi:hypothetical protein
MGGPFCKWSPLSSAMRKDGFMVFFLLCLLDHVAAFAGLVQPPRQYLPACTSNASNAYIYRCLKKYAHEKPSARPQYICTKQEPLHQKNEAQQHRHFQQQR